MKPINYKVHMLAGHYNENEIRVKPNLMEECETKEKKRHGKNFTYLDNL